MADPRLLDALRAADRSLRRERLPPRGVRRIAQRIARELDRRERQARWPWVPMMTFVAGAALVLAFLAWARAPKVDTSPVMTPHRALVAGADCSRVGADGAVAVEGACQVISGEPGMRIQTMADAKLDVEDRTIRLAQGTALFDVDPVAGEPVRVQTPAGVVIVVGTRFTVVVADGTTRVDLFEGKLRFQGADGGVTAIEAGEQWAFGETQGGGELLEDIEIELIDDTDADPDAADAHAWAEGGPAPAGGKGTAVGRRDGSEVRPTAQGRRGPGEARGDGSDVRPEHGRRGSGEARGEGSDVRPTADGRQGTGKAGDGRQSAAPRPHDAEAPKGEPQLSAGAVIEHVHALRRTGDYKEAARALEAALRRPWPRRTAEVLSYELGRILARHLQSGARACKHWRRHLAKFPRTRYRDQVTASETALGCSVQAP